MIPNHSFNVYFLIIGDTEPFFPIFINQLLQGFDKSLFGSNSQILRLLFRFWNWWLEFFIYFCILAPHQAFVLQIYFPIYSQCSPGCPETLCRPGWPQAQSSTASAFHLVTTAPIFLLFLEKTLCSV